MKTTEELEVHNSASYIVSTGRRIIVVSTGNVFASSAVTYTSVYTDSEPGRVFWGADEELSDGGPPRVIVYGYDGLLMQPPHDPDYVPEPIYPEYIPLEDEHVFSTEEQPLPPVVSPTAESPGYVVKSDPEEDPEEYKDDKMEDGPVDYPIDRGKRMEMMITAIHPGMTSMMRMRMRRMRRRRSAGLLSELQASNIPPQKSEEVEETSSLGLSPPPSPPISLSPSCMHERLARYEVIRGDFTARYYLMFEVIDYGVIWQHLDAEERRRLGQALEWTYMLTRGLLRINLGTLDAATVAGYSYSDTAPDGRDSPSDERHETIDGGHAGRIVSIARAAEES
ncbi:hypothetical protein Tco_0398260 [Tanacetum coccineum]